MMMENIAKAILIFIVLAFIVTVVTVVGWVIKELIIWFWERRKKRDH